jgi:hypothetical protein
MRISTTNHYYHRGECDVRDCARQYCPEHRLLWRQCETIKQGWEGDPEVINGTRRIFEFGDCPACEHQEERKRMYREMERRMAGKSICPVCFQAFDKPDDTAIHLVDVHVWDAEHGRLWLRDKIEEVAFYEKP